MYFLFQSVPRRAIVYQISSYLHTLSDIFPRVVAREDTVTLAAA
jgi:hypothetical protein